MKISPLFVPRNDDVDQLVADYPFAQIVSFNEGSPVCTPLPLLLERSENESWLVGHFAKANPHVGMLKRNPRALAVFMGPHGYISPSWMRDRTQAPTWNYATAHFEVDVVFEEDDASAHAALDKLVFHLEKGRSRQWDATEMGARYERLASAVIAFKAKVLSLDAKFKLGQNERPDVLSDIFDGLHDTGQSSLLAAMRVANPGQG